MSAKPAPGRKIVITASNGNVRDFCGGSVAVYEALYGPWPAQNWTDVGPCSCSRCTDTGVSAMHSKVQTAVNLALDCRPVR